MLGDERELRSSYKPTVRLFKRWMRQYMDQGKMAPSFYIECAVHNVVDAKRDVSAARLRAGRP